jgi:hypothetical protein
MARSGVDAGDQSLKSTRAWMNAVKDKIIGIFREGPFAKYAVALMGLVVLMLAINGATEAWISYRATDAMSEKAETTAKRIEQSVSELARQISWVTRASVVTLEDRRKDYAQLLNHVAPIRELAQFNGQGRERLRQSRTAISLSSGTDFSRDPRFTETLARGVNFSPAYFSEAHPFMSISVAYAGFNAGVTVADIDLQFLSDILGDAEVGKVAYAYVVDPKGRVLATSAKGPEIASDLSALPHALIAPGGRRHASHIDAAGHSVLTASATVPKLGWIVLFEQPATQVLSPTRDQLVRSALLVALGLAILAGHRLLR